MANTLFDEILEEAGVEEEGRTFLKARGITSVAIMGYVCASEQEVHDKLGMQFVNGVTLGTTTYKLQGQQDVWLAVLKYVWSRCKQTVTLTLAPTTTNVTTNNTSPSTSNTTKPPTNLPLGVWAQQIHKYQEITLHGQDRVFPVKMLVGAEKILARMWHEHTQTKMYTPTHLGEIVQALSLIHI